MNRTWRRVTTVVSLIVGVTVLLHVWSTNLYTRQNDTVMLHRLGATSLMCPDLHFSRNMLPVTALVSSPGSGNTWLRHLLQQATGIYTGSVYRDKTLLRNGFPGEKCINGSVIAVKTHRRPGNGPSFQRAVLIIRDPYGSILSEFNRRRCNHTCTPPGSVLETGAVWRKSVRSSSNQWLNLNRAWLKYEGPLHVVFYEHVKADTKKELTAMLEFLGFPTTYLHCALFNSNGNFHRKKAKKLDEDLYDKTLREIVDKRKRDIYSRALKRKRNR